MQVVLLGVFLLIGPLASVSGQRMTNGLGLGIALLAFPAVLVADGCQKYLKSRLGHAVR